MLNCVRATGPILATTALLCLPATPARACELAYFEPLESVSDFCEIIQGVVDFEVTETRANPDGDSMEGLFTIDPETGESSPTAAWTPDRYDYPHLDVQFRVLASYGARLPERVALIEIHGSRVSLENPLFVTGERYRLYGGKHLGWNGQIVIDADCNGSVIRLDSAAKPPACPWAAPPSEGPTRGHGCASCSVEGRDLFPWREALVVALGLVALYRRRRARS